MFSIKLFPTLLMLASLSGYSWAAPSLPPVSVTVFKTVASGGVRYQYKVSNNSKFPITSVIIGYNYFDARPQLNTVPKGWTLGSGIPSSSVSSPPGWSAKVTTTEEESKIEIEWSIHSPGAALAQGQRLQGFGILVPAADDTYLKSDWTTYVDGAGTNVYTGALSEQASCSTPRLSVSLSPNILWPPNHKLVKIQATISAQDESSPNPAIVLVSVTANEKLTPGDVAAQIGTAARTFSVKSERTGNSEGGRIYSVTYSAKNSCGNSATATEIITVPHDWRK